ncbi:hypothetical protein [Catenulispora pinisilvae]|uniref:hypothetical protein n=1 Tax=Catenulispora pinisilvae TaxID=2705253 RepID=UPI001891ED8F|nr:hypothetical protein [Catenulispora pinisilvae]
MPRRTPANGVGGAGRGADGELELGVELEFGVAAAAEVPAGFEAGFEAEVEVEIEAEVSGGFKGEAEEVSSNMAGRPSAPGAASSPKPSQERRRRGDGIGVRRDGVRPGGDVRRKIRPA